jgi:hypothetical protein
MSLSLPSIALLLKARISESLLKSNGEAYDPARLRTGGGPASLMASAFGVTNFIAQGLAPGTEPSGPRCGLEMRTGEFACRQTGRRNVSDPADLVSGLQCSVLSARLKASCFSN